jgi:glycerate-2-kinase
VTAGRAVLRLLRRLELRAEDLVLVLLSGGASALLPAPRRGVGFAAKRRITRSLLERGASIEETNAIRKQLSRLKGGGLLRLASPARVLTLAISDVPGDDPRVIGSGPGVAPNPADLTAARRAARRYLSGADRRLVLRLIENGKKTPGGRRGHALVIGSGRTFIEAAAREARVRGYRVRKRVNCLRGEARRMGPRLTRDHPDRERVATLWSGETVVTVRGRGIGGRNLEVALAAIPGLSRRGRPSVLVTVATDGCDGPSGASGALVDDVSHRSLRAASVRIAEALRSNDSRLALAAIGALRSTGPTGTNVGDIALMLG